jgi:uncharacterized protein YaaN involved in tellurite resistance
MKATIVQWRMLVQTQDAAKMSKIVQEASNEWLQAYAQAGAMAVPAIAEAIQTPTLTPQTIAAMADSVSKQADGIVHALEVGTQRREEMESAIIDAGKIITDSSARVSDAQIEHITAAATKPLEISTSVPTAEPVVS